MLDHVIENLTIHGTITDIDGQKESIAEGGVVSISKRVTRLVGTTTGEITLAAPAAGSVGRVKVLEMTAANGAITLSLANCVGGSAATTASFDAVGEVLVLVAGVAKWVVVGQAGVTLT